MKIAVILNTNKLGGAERSLIEQLKVISHQHEFHFYFPELKTSHSELKEFLLDKGFTNFDSIRYPFFVYQLSRSNLIGLPIFIMKAPLLVYYLFLWHKIFKNYSTFYLNGNKACLPVFLWSFFFRKSVSFIWHFRDYPSPKAFTVLGYIFSKCKRNFKNLTLVANSFAVGKELTPYFPSVKIITLYNLPGDLPQLPAPESIERIGIVAMLAPWKGLHDVLLSIAIHKKELKLLGIKKFTFYGSSIYQTDGVHKNYEHDLQELCSKLKLGQFVEFAGLKRPEEIYSQIDLLIHPTLTAEPFGRVIIEAFKSRRPVISTGIGGAGELVTHEQNGLVYSAYDSASLFNSLKRLAQNNEMVTHITFNAFEKLKILEEEVKEQIINLFPPEG